METPDLRTVSPRNDNQYDCGKGQFSSVTLTRQVVSGVKWNSIVVPTRVGVQFVTLALLARLLAPNEFGLMNMAVVVTGFASSFTDFGLSNAIIQRQNATREQLSSLYWFNLVVGWSLFALIWLSTPLVVAYYKEPALAAVLRWSAVSFFIVPFGQQFQSLLRRELRFKTLSFIQILENITYAIAAIVFAYIGFGVMSLVWATLLRAIVSVGALLYVASRSLWLPHIYFRLTDISSFVGFGFFQMGERSFNYLSANIDYLIIGRLLGVEPLGYYTLAYNLIRIPLSYLNPIIVAVAFPSFARVGHEDEVLRRAYAKILHYLSAVTFPATVGLFIAAPLLIPLVYGPQWLPSVPVVQIFCLLGAVKSLGNPIGSLLLAKGRADLGFYANAVAILGYGVSNWIGSQWGIMGVAASSLVFSLLVLLPLEFYLRWRIIKMSVRDYWKAIEKTALSSVVLILVLIFLRLGFHYGQHKIAELVGQILVGTAVYTLILWIFDRSLFREAWGYLKPTDVAGKR